MITLTDIPSAAPLTDTPAFLPRMADYQCWREEKLTRYPRSAAELVVEVSNPLQLTTAEAAEIRRRCNLANMAVYAGPPATADDKAADDQSAGDKSAGDKSANDKAIPRRIGEQLGLHTLQSNLLADADRISALEVSSQKSGRGYLPYSNQRLLWHTDGYYNPPELAIRAFILHCVRAAAAGGENRLLDPEIAYILLRDADPGYVCALEAPDAMTIPANTEAAGTQRPASTGPVFSMQQGCLHMRYTARTRSIIWRDDARTRAAAECLRNLLEGDTPHIFTLRLAPGQGLVCNNVLHNRSAFTDTAQGGYGRLIYRARYTERVAATAARIAP